MRKRRNRVDSSRHLLITPMLDARGEAYQAPSSDQCLLGINSTLPRAHMKRKCSVACSRIERSSLESAFGR